MASFAGSGAGGADSGEPWWRKSQRREPPETRKKAAAQGSGRAREWWSVAREGTGVGRVSDGGSAG